MRIIMAPALIALLFLPLHAGCRKSSERASSSGARPMKQRGNGLETSIQIPSIGVFNAEPWEDGKIHHYTHPLEFKGKIAELIIYPNQDRSPLSGAQKETLRQRFRQFEQSVDYALAADLPDQLRTLCREYRIDIAHLTDEQLRSGLNWTNIKLEPEGTIECYTKNLAVTDNFDIVLGFSPDMRLVYVCFDG